MCKILYFLLGVSFAVSRIATAGAPASATFDCASTFPSNMSVADLRVKFGTEDVESGEVHLGEGEYETGTILFPNDPSRRVEILWHDQSSNRFPRSVGALNSESSWKTPEGIVFGTDLKTVEARNSRPFRLRGYGV